MILVKTETRLKVSKASNVTYAYFTLCLAQKIGALKKYTCLVDANIKQASTCKNLIRAPGFFTLMRK